MTAVGTGRTLGARSSAWQAALLPMPVSTHSTPRPQGGNAASPAEQAEQLECIDPAFALHAALLMDPTTEPFPFSGEWPNLHWSQELCRATLSLIACKVLPYDASVQPDQAYKALFEGLSLKCRRAIGVNTANSRGLPEEPVFFKTASWRRAEGRRIVQMKLLRESTGHGWTASLQHSAAVGLITSSAASSRLR